MAVKMDLGAAALKMELYLLVYVEGSFILSAVALGDSSGF